MGRVKEMWLEMQERGDWPTGLEDKYVCASHFDDIYLQKKIRSYGNKGICSYCGKKKLVANMQEFGEFISQKIHDSYDNVYEAALLNADDFYDDDNEIIPGFKNFCGFVVPNETECYEETSELLYNLDFNVNNESLRKDVVEIFTTQEWVSRDILGTENKDVHMIDLWDKFSYMVKYQRRFTFLADPKYIEILDIAKHPRIENNILSVLCSLINKTGLVKTLTPENVLFRARKVDELKEKFGFEDITSPPDKSAFQNRMSPAGVSVFYASFDKETTKEEAVGEEPVGILIGEFRPKRRLRVVDLTSIPRELSFWMDYYQENKFLKKFNAEVTKSVDSDYKGIEYIPTQVFTEYLRYMFKDDRGREVDGIIYGSSHEIKNKNLVLFCNQKSSKEYVELTKPIEVYTKKWVRVNECK